MPSFFNTVAKSSGPKVIKAISGRAPISSHPYTGLSSANVPRSSVGTPFVAGNSQRQNLNAHGFRGSKIT
jgi:hypothetical protein